MSLTLRISIVMALLAAAPCAAEEVPSFQNDVLPILTKAGCNMGGCHGNQNGKGGFKLSLRGEDAEFDVRASVREHGARRLDPVDPENSLILAKPSGRVAHQGGVRFTRESLEYRTLLAWLSAGAPGVTHDEPRVVALDVKPRRTIVFDKQQPIGLEVIAQYSDGSTRDVTNVAVYEPSNLQIAVDPFGVITARDWCEATVLVRLLDKQAPVTVIYAEPHARFRWQPPPELNYIDQHIFAKLKSLRVQPSPIASDATFVRRAYLDALGILPTAEEARDFVADERADKRARLIETLLARPEFAEHWALKWADVLRAEEKVLDEPGVAALHGWIKQGIAQGKPLDQFVRELVTAGGKTFENPPANFYRANRDPVTRGETAARLFLGVRLQCAKCHNHPFDRWTQDDYYGWAANFARIEYEIGENKRSDKLDLNEFKGEQTVLFKTSGEVKNARTGQDAVPKFLGAQTPPLADDADRLAPLAAWLTSKDNRLFIDAQVNFIWYHVMGRGLIEPIDDVRPTNPPSHPELMDDLARDFVRHNFDLKQLVRTIMTSQTYGLDSAPNETNAADTLNYSRGIVKRLAAEKLLDAQCQVLGVPAKFSGEEEGLRAGQMAGVNAPGRRGKLSEADRFLRTFGKPDRLLACECERSNETTLNQALMLTGGEGLQRRLTDGNNRLAKLAASERSDAEIIEELYWTALGRAPSAEEASAAAEALAEDRLAGLQDLAWALINAKEFLFRH